MSTLITTSPTSISKTRFWWLNMRERATPDLYIPSSTPSSRNQLDSCWKNFYVLQVRLVSTSRYSRWQWFQPCSTNWCIFDPADSHTSLTRNGTTRDTIQRKRKTPKKTHPRLRMVVNVTHWMNKNHLLHSVSRQRGFWVNLRSWKILELLWLVLQTLESHSWRPYFPLATCTFQTSHSYHQVVCHTIISQRRQATWKPIPPAIRAKNWKS